MMAEIVLATLNAKFIHAAFGLRYLLANLGPLRERTALVEFDVRTRPLEIVETILKHSPRIVGFGVYIWNVAQTTEVVATLKRLRPDVVVVLGGPEVSFETEEQRVTGLADYVITGEGDLAFRELCLTLLGGRRPGEKIIPAAPPGFAELALPYELYTTDDLPHRVIYVEASRGCPFQCEFCLSSLEVPVRAVETARFLKAMRTLLTRGAPQLKFVDRTFNLHLPTSRAILEFCLEQWQPGRCFHFELVPDRLPAELREVIARFPAGALQFEVGIQTFNPEVAARIQRRQNYERVADNLRWLRRETGVHVHADLIFGLPGESLASFAAGFDQLVALEPQEIQVGILKRLRGTPIIRHDAEWGVIWSPQPPYEMLENRLVDFATLQRMRRFAHYWDLVANSGSFVETCRLLWRGQDSAFAAFARWSEWLFGRVGRTDSIALARLTRLLHEYLVAELALPDEEAEANLHRDYERTGRRDLPGAISNAPAAPTLPHAFRRQRRHSGPPAE